MKRTYMAFKNMEHRFKTKKLPFSVEELRIQVSETLKAGICPLCLDRITPKSFGVDHMIPVSRSGSLEISNIEIVCMSCNRAKGDLTREEFLKLVEVLRTLGPKVMRSVLGRLKAGGAISSRRFGGS